MRRVVLDVDTGIDDALAILYAVASPTLDLRGVTTVVGNVPADVAARSSLAVLARAGAHHVPVAVGATRTLAGAGPRPGPTDHGPDGLGGVLLPVEPRRMGQVGGHLTETDDGRLLDVVVGVDAPAVATAFVETLLLT